MHSIGDHREDGVDTVPYSTYRRRAPLAHRCLKESEPPRTYLKRCSCEHDIELDVEGTVWHTSKLSLHVAPVEGYAVGTTLMLL